MRFIADLYDLEGFHLQRRLTDAFNMIRVHELNEEHSLTFSFPLKHPDAKWIKERKIIRLTDLLQEDLQSGISSSTLATKEIVTDTAIDLNIGDYVITYDDEFLVRTRTTAVATAGTATTVVVNSATGISAGMYLIIEDENDSESFSVDSILAPNITTDLANSYVTGASISSPGRSFVAKVIEKNNSTTYKLSRMDFAPPSDAIVRKVDFETFRISEITESRESGVPTIRVRADHITFDLNDQQFFFDSRVDISYASRGPNQVIEDLVDVSTFLDNILRRQVDGSGNPLSLSSFIKGDMYRFRYKKGTLSTDGTTTVTLSSLGDVQYFSAGSLLAIEGEPSLLTVQRVNTDNNEIILSAAASNTASSLDYLLISKGTFEDTDIIGIFTVENGDSFVIPQAGLLDDTIANGAVFQVEGDDTIYYVDYVDEVTP